MEDEEDVRRVRAALQIKGMIHWSVLHDPHFCASKVQFSNFQYKTCNCVKHLLYVSILTLQICRVQGFWKLYVNLRGKL